jgi:hypothetical protein
MTEHRFKKGEWVFRVDNNQERKSIISSFFKEEESKALHISGMTMVDKIIFYKFENCETLRGVNLLDIHYRFATEKEIKETKIKDIFKNKKTNPS